MVADPARRRGSFPVAESDVPSPIHPIGPGPEPGVLVDVGDGHLAAG